MGCGDVRVGRNCLGRVCADVWKVQEGNGESVVNGW